MSDRDRDRPSAELGATESLCVIVPAWREAASLPACLSALRRAAASFAPVRLVLVAGGPDGTFEEAERLVGALPGIEATVRRQRPGGKMQALSEGIAALGSEPVPDWILLLDADTQLEEGSLAAAAQVLRSREDLIGVGGHLVTEDRRVGAAHDLVRFRLAAEEPRLPMVTGFAILLRGPAIWPHRAAIFGPHDYPTHVDYQICERTTACTALHFAVPVSFRVRSARGRGLTFLATERRHHRALFRRSPPRTWRRYVLGAALTTGLPFFGPAAVASLVVPPLAPIAVLALGLGARRLARLRRDFRRARDLEPALIEVPFLAFVRDEWMFSLSAMLAALDWLVRRPEALHVRGPR